MGRFFDSMTTDLRFPIGKFHYAGPYSEAQRREFIEQIEEAPDEIRRAYEQLPAGGLDMPYRPGGWTARQVIHHVPESHMNSYLRFKFALTENGPTIKAYDENAWAQTPEVQNT